LTRLERSIARVLQAGVWASSACLAAGLLLSVLHVAVASGLLQAGILILICTPVARVVISLVEYTAARDRAFATLTAVVLLELMGSALAALVFNRKL